MDHFLESWSFKDRIPKQELGNEQTRLQMYMKIIKSITEYIDVVQKVLSEISIQIGGYDPIGYSWFRGQSNKNWDLIPRLYRLDENAFTEREMYRDFKLRSDAFISIPPECYLEQLFIMQHHGMPTRLLDWTESHLFALFFAVESENSDFDAAVWIFRAAELNKLSGYGKSIPMSNHKIFRKYELNIDLKKPDDKILREVSAPYPMAVRPRRNTTRIVAQRGMFTIHGKEKNSIFDYVETQKSSDKIFRKIIISGKSKSQIKKELFLAGISYSTLFPDLDGLSKEISYRFSEKYLNQHFLSD